mmetsp:Transcript_37835/g.60747  ORF Transcript_37835/g.60747 Transcript_37835/m.60747 type:complete len:231 (-) Transcript_37835:288-980(-)
MPELTKKLIVSRSGEFCLESVFSLRLSKENIRLTSALERCVNLKTLDLSQNGLRDLLVDYKRIDSMAKLKFLDLKQNRLKNLDSLPTCERLEILHLEGNLIANVRELEILQTRAPQLKQLYLENSSANLRNPLCRTKHYSELIVKMLPGLTVLNGMRLNYEYSLYNLGKSIEKAFCKNEEEEKGDDDSRMSPASRSSGVELCPELEAGLDEDVDKLESLLASCKKLVKQQ